MERLRERIAEYTPEAVEKICGTDAALVRRFADVFAESKSATNVTSSNFSKYYHGNLVERSQALLFALGGHIGRKGGGFVAFPFLTHDSFDLMTVGRTGLVDSAKLYANILPKQQMLKWQGFTEEMVHYEFSRESFVRGDIFTCGTLFWNVHGGLLERGKPGAAVIQDSGEREWHRETRTETARHVLLREHRGEPVGLDLDAGNARDFELA